MVDKKYNPALLKLELLSNGLLISEKAQEKIGTEIKDVLRMRTGAGTGLEMFLEKQVIVSAPTAEDFCYASPFLLDINSDGSYVIFKNGRFIQKVTPYPRPKYYSKTTSDGTPMRKIGGLQGDFLSFAVDRRCWFWGHYDKDKIVKYRGKQCKFCGIGVEWSGRDPIVYTTEQILEVCEEALKEKYVNHIAILAGTFPPPGRGHEEYATLIKAIKERFDIWVRLSIAPPEEEKYVDMLYEAGADLVGYNYEAYDPQYYKEICPGKYEEIDKGVAHQQFDRILKYASKTAGRDKVFSALLAGIEPRRNTVKGIRYLSSLGVLPRVFVFRPLKGTEFSGKKTSSSEDLVYIYRNMKKIIEGEFHEDVGCPGCARNEIATKTYLGLNPRMPEITDEDLEFAGIDPKLTY